MAYPDAPRLFAGLDIVRAMESGERSAAARRKQALEERREKRAQKLADLNEEIKRRQLASEKADAERRAAIEAAQTPELVQAATTTQVTPAKEGSLAEQMGNVAQAGSLAEQTGALAPGLEGPPDPSTLQGPPTPDEPLQGPPTPESVKETIDYEKLGTTPERLAAAKRMVAEKQAADRVAMTAKLAERMRREKPEKALELLNKPVFKRMVEKGQIEDLRTASPKELQAKLEAHTAMGEILGNVQHGEPKSKQGELVRDLIGVENLNTPSGRAKLKEFLESQAIIEQGLKAKDIIGIENNLNDRWTKSNNSPHLLMNTLASAVGELMAVDPNNPAGQYKAIVKYAKLMDPISAVREGEVTAVQEIIDMWDKLGFKLDEVVGGQKTLVGPENIRFLQKAAQRSLKQFYHNVYKPSYAQARGQLESQQHRFGREGSSFDIDKTIPFATFRGPIAKILGEEPDEVITPEVPGEESPPPPKSSVRGTRDEIEAANERIRGGQQ